MDISIEDSPSYTYLGMHKIASQAYDNRIEDAAICYRRKGLYNLFEQFNAYCSRHDIHYFAIADTLVGAIVYGDFIPGKSFAEVGMTRSEYMRLESLLNSESDDPAAQSERGFLLNCRYGGMRILRPSIESLMLTDVVDDSGRLLYKKNHLPYSEPSKIWISIFDELPDDADSRKVFLARTRLLSLIAEAAFRKHGGNLGDEGSKYSKLVEFLSRIVPASMAIEHCWKVCGKHNGGQKSRLRRIVYKRSKIMPSADLLPYRMLTFGDTVIEAPHCSSTWIFEDQDSLNNEIDILQKDALQIAIEIDRVCKLIGVDYFICGGTMLGYVRHGGFIPWDDDIDLGMLRDDYERFIREAPKYLSDEYFLQTRESDPLIPYLFSKVRLNNSEYITEYNRDRDFHKGICVDLFPFDKIPNDNVGQKSMQSKARDLSTKHNRVANHQLPEPMDKVPVRSVFAFASRVFGKLQRRYYWRKSLADTQKAYHDFVKSYNDEEAFSYVASFVPTFTMVHIDDLLPYRRVEFEGTVLSAPACPEVFLQMQYGNYMELPMPHQQRGHQLLWWSDPVHGRHEGVNKEQEQ